MKTIYVIGAGASISHTHQNYPTIAEIFRKAREQGLIDEKVHDKLVDYIRKIFGKDILGRGANIDAERVYTAIEIDIEKNEERSAPVRTQFTEILTKLFCKLQINSPGKTEKSDYKSFIEKLKETDTIITFNWDVLLDNFLGREKSLKDNASKEGTVIQYSNFLLQLSGYSAEYMVGESCPPKKRGGQDAEKKSGFYIKLHGSIDWRFCANENCRLYGTVFPVPEPLENYDCKNCDEEVKTMIIPPTLNKPIRRIPFIRRLWNLAAAEIQYTNRLVIWGYGLPDTDFYSEWLLRQARKCEALKELVLINPRVILESKKRGKILRRTFIRKFTEIYNDDYYGVAKNKRKILYLYENFADYQEKRDILQKYGVKHRSNEFPGFVFHKNQGDLEIS